MLYPPESAKLKALRVLSYMVDMHPDGLPGNARVFWDDLVAYHLLSKGYIKIGSRVFVTPKGREAVDIHLKAIGNA